MENTQTMPTPRRPVLHVGPRQAAAAGGREELVEKHAGAWTPGAPDTGIFKPSSNTALPSPNHRHHPELPALLPPQVVQAPVLALLTIDIYHLPPTHPCAPLLNTQDFTFSKIFDITLEILFLKIGQS